MTNYTEVTYTIKPISGENFTTNTTILPIQRKILNKLGYCHLSLFTQYMYLNNKGAVFIMYISYDIICLFNKYCYVFTHSLYFAANEPILIFYLIFNSVTDFFFIGRYLITILKDLNHSKSLYVSVMPYSLILM